MSKSFTIDDVEGHDVEEDMWIVIEGKVYDVTEYLEKHPGGSGVICEVAGADATEEYNDAGHRFVSGYSC